MTEPSIAKEMRPNHQPLDENTASRLLQGLVHPDDAPPGYSAVADLLNSAAQVPLDQVDEDAATATISAMVEAIRSATPAPEISRRKTMLGKLLAGKALAAVAVLGLTATGAAAAAGSLPDQVQGVVSDAVSHVGVDIPHPNHGKSAEHRQDGKHRPDGDDVNEVDEDEGQPDQNGQPDNHGQATSDAAHNAKTAAKEAGEKVGPAVCAAVTDGKCQAGEHGKAGGSENESTGTDGDDSGQPGKSGEDHGKSNDSHGAGDDHATTPTTGGIATGEKHSGRDLPSGKGKGGGGH